MIKKYFGKNILKISNLFSKSLSQNEKKMILHDFGKG